MRKSSTYLTRVEFVGIIVLQFNWSLARPFPTSIPSLSLFLCVIGKTISKIYYCISTSNNRIYLWFLSHIFHFIVSIDSHSLATSIRWCYSSCKCTHILYAFFCCLPVHDSFAHSFTHAIFMCSLTHTFARSIDEC